MANPVVLDALDQPIRLGHVYGYSHTKNGFLIRGFGVAETLSETRYTVGLRMLARIEQLNGTPDRYHKHGSAIGRNELIQVSGQRVFPVPPGQVEEFIQAVKSKLQPEG